MAGWKPYLQVNADNLALKKVSSSWCNQVFVSTSLQVCLHFSVLIISLISSESDAIKTVSDINFIFCLNTFSPYVPVSRVVRGRWRDTTS